MELSGDGLRLSLKLPIVSSRTVVTARAPSQIALTKFVPMQMKRRGVEMRMVLEGDSNPIPD